MRKLLFIVMLILCVCIFTVSAEQIHYDYTDSGSGTSSVHSSSGAGAAMGGLIFEEMSAYTSFTTLVFGVERAPFGSPDWTSKTTDVQFSIDGDTIGTGTYTVTNVWNSDRTSVDSVIGCFEVESWDVYGYSGIQFVDIDFEDEYFENKYYASQVSSSVVYQLTSHAEFKSDGIHGVFLKYATNDYILYGPYEATAYYATDFHQVLTYSENDIYMDIYLDRGNKESDMTIANESGAYLWYSNSDDIDEDLKIYDKPIWVNVTNPYTSNIWTNLIPETTTPTVADTTAMIHSYVYDAVTGHLLGSGHNVSVLYDSGSSSETQWPSGVSHTTIDWSDETACNLTYSADGYTDSPTQKYVASSLDTSGIFLQVGDEVTTSAYLMPTGGGPTNTTYYLSFEVLQEVAPNSGVLSRSSDAAVTCDGEQRLTGPVGTTWFNVTAGTYPYTVSKNGFETIQGSVTVSDNTVESVTLYQTMAEPTLSENTTGEVDPEAMHEAVAEAYNEFAGFIPEAVLIACVLFLLSMFKKF